MAVPGLDPPESGSLPALGCGGPSRLGTRTPDGDPINVIKAAHELGVTIFDTAESYNTETVLAQAIKHLNINRDTITIATKTSPKRPGPYAGPYLERPCKTPAQLTAHIHASLRSLNTDYIDIYFLHAPLLQDYDHCAHHLVPELLKHKDAGILRAIGVTEMFAHDTTHQMLQRALQDDWLDAIMVGFNILNQSARHTVFPIAAEKNITTLNMFSVRRALTNRHHLIQTIADMLNAGNLDPDLVNPDNPFDFLDAFDNHTSNMHGPGGVTETAYRFVAHEPHVNITLFGTGNPAHARDNINAINKPPLPTNVRDALIQIFGTATSVSGN